VHPTGRPEIQPFDHWIDPIETGVQERVRNSIQALVQAELDATLCRHRYVRAAISIGL
jgi:hypothetical protein